MTFRNTLARADAVLATSEMQAIKAALKKLGHTAMGPSTDPRWHELGGFRFMLQVRYGLPPDVVDWVLS